MIQKIAFRVYLPRTKQIKSMHLVWKQKNSHLCFGQLETLKREQMKLSETIKKSDHGTPTGCFLGTE